MAGLSWRASPAVSRVVFSIVDGAGETAPGIGWEAATDGCDETLYVRSGRDWALWTRRRCWRLYCVLYGSEMPRIRRI